MSEDVLQVEDLLAQLTQEGELQSSGQFTLDVSRAKETLAKYQFADPYYYVLKLVQAAVVGGAREFSVKSGSTEVAAAMLGLGFTPHQLENLLYSLLADDQGRALRHLAMSVNAAVNTRASQITIQSFDGREGLEVTWTRDGQKATRWAPDKPYAQTRFVMKRTTADVISETIANLGSRDIFSMLSGGPKGMDREQKLIYDHCALCTLPISINGKPCPGYELGAPAYENWWARWFGGSLSSKHHLFEVYLPKGPGVGLAAPRQTFSSFPRGFQSDGVFSAILAAPARPPEFTVVLPLRDGITLEPVKLDWQGPSGLFYVDAHELDVDLTEVKLVRSEKTLKALQELGTAYCQVGLEWVAASRQTSRLRTELEHRLKAGLESPMVFIAPQGGTV